MWKLMFLFAGKSLNFFSDYFLSSVSSIILELVFFGYWTFWAGLLSFILFLLFSISPFKLLYIYVYIYRRYPKFYLLTHVLVSKKL